MECNDRQCLHQYVSSGIGLTIGSYRSLGEATQQNIAAVNVIDFDEIQSELEKVQEEQNLNNAQNVLNSITTQEEQVEEPNPEDVQ